MDNFRKSKANKAARGAVDGMVRSSQMPRSKSKIQVTPNTQLKAEKPVTRIGNFKATDGFSPTKQSQIRTNMSQMGRQPHRKDDGSIDLDLPESSRQSRFKSPKKAHRGRVNLRRFASLFMACLVLFSGFVFGRVYLKANQIFQGGGGAIALGKNVDPSRLKGEGDGRVNILMLGKGGVGHEGADLTDTILVASINPIQKEAAIVSIPRDLYVKTPESGSMKINAVYSTAKQKSLYNSNRNDPSKDEEAEKAGLEAIDNMVQNILGVPIHYHAMVDFDGFKEAIDTVGGVDLDVKSAVAEQMYIEGSGPYYLNVKEGQQHFDGFRALAYSRSRHTSPRGDFDRSERQRGILVALKEKILTLGTLANPLKINQLISNFGDHIKINMTVDEMMRLYDIGKDIDNSKIQSVGLADPPNDYVRTGNIDGLSIVQPKAGLNNYNDIHSFIRNKLKDGYLADENATVLVLNGTNVPGLAGRTTDELKSYGYNLLPAGDAPTKGYSNTVIVDLRNGEKKYTKRYLEQRFGTTVVPNLPDSTISPQSADFVIIIGQNEVNRLNN